MSGHPSLTEGDGEEGQGRVRWGVVSVTVRKVEVRTVGGPGRVRGKEFLGRVPEPVNSVDGRGGCGWGLLERAET